MPPCSLHRVAGDLHAARSVMWALAMCRVAGGVLGDVVEGVGRVPEEAARRLDRRGHVRELVLHGLELGDRPAELPALLGVVDGELRHAPGRAEGVGGKEREARVAHARAGAGTALERLGRRTVEVQLRDGTRAVDAGDRLHAQPVRSLLHHGEATAGHAHDEDVGHVRVGHVALRAAQASARVLEGPVGGLPRVVGLADRDGADRLAGRQCREPALALRFAAAQGDRDAGQRVTEEGTRQAAVAQRLRRQRQLEHLQARAAVGLGHDEPGEAHLRQALPERRVVPGAGVEDLPQARRRTLALDEALHRLLQQLLLLGQAEMHGRH